MVSSFHPHSMCEKVERVTAKTGCTSCTKRTISFEVSGFHMKTRMLQRDFIFLNLFELQTICVFKMHHSRPHHQFSTISDFIWYLSCIYWFFGLNDLEIEKHYKWTLNRLKVGMVSSFHPHSMCEKVERVTGKAGCTSCTKRTICFEVSRFHTETRLLQRDFNFLELIWTPLFFCVQNAPFKATSSIYNPFWLHLLFFTHLLIILSYKTMKLKSIRNEL